MATSNELLGAAGLGVAAVAALYYMNNRPAAVQFPMSLNKQSVILPGPERIRASAFYPELEGKREFVETFHDGVRTCYDAFQRGLQLSDNGRCLGWREKHGGPYKWLSYQQVFDCSKHFGAGLVMKGLTAGPSTFIGIYSQNRKEWVMVEQSCYLYSFVLVPLYDTLGPDACNYIINQAEMKAVVCDTEEKVKGLLANMKDAPGLSIIISMEPVSEMVAKCAADNVQLLTFAEIMELGKNNPQELTPPKPSDLVTVCYTSGTTGNPKGVMMTHGNMIADIAGVVHLTEKYTSLKFTPDDVSISYLPLAHMFERLNESMMFAHGGSIGFFRGDILKLMDDIKELRPTYFPVVPRLLQRIHDKVMAALDESKFKKMLFSVALHSKNSEIQRGIIRNNSVWDKFVFANIQKTFGGRLKVCITGAAPISDKVMTFARCTFGAFVLEGYGQTESSGAATLTVPGDPCLGHIGAPLICNHIKLIDAPDLECYAADDKGEICIKGPNVSCGYLHNPEKTAETIDKDGWLHTGDVGTWLPNGTLKIVDRVKHIFKLSQGEYLAPEKIENIYVRSKLIAQVFVDGSSLQNYAVGIAVPDADVFIKWAHSKGFKGTTLAALCSNKEVEAQVLKEMTEVGKEGGLKSFEQIKKMTLEENLFSVENGLLTPTFKAKRATLRQHFKDKIDDMYRSD